MPKQKYSRLAIRIIVKSTMLLVSYEFLVNDVVQKSNEMLLEVRVNWYFVTMLPCHGHYFYTGYLQNVS